MSEATPLLELASVRAGYGHAEVLHDIDLTVGEEHERTSQRCRPIDRRAHPRALIIGAQRGHV